MGTLYAVPLLLLCTTHLNYSEELASRSLANLAGANNVLILKACTPHLVATLKAVSAVRARCAIVKLVKS